jgi:hypothetical protein
MFIWTEFSTRRVFPNARPERTSRQSVCIHGARGGYASAQIILRDIYPVHLNKISVVRADGAREKKLGIRLFKQEYTVYNDMTAYPDRLTQLRPGRVNINIPPHMAQGFLIDFYVPEDAAPGTTEFKVTFSAGSGEAAVDVALTVHKAVIAPAASSRFGHEYFFNTQLLPKGCKIRRFTDEWWELLGHYADVMRELRNNVICVSLKELLTRAGSEKKSDESYEFRWELFDRYVQTFIDRAAAREFTLNAPIQSVEGKYLDAIGPGGENERLETLTKPAEKYLRELYGAVQAHLKEKGWDGIFRAHIEDEPHTTEAWLWADAILHEAAPCLTTGEPLDMIESARVITGNAKWAVPRINVYEEDPPVFFDYVGRGGELWLYSCCFPEESWWLNKFVDLPFIRSRQMEWACVSVGARGFLHWGFNYWGNGDSLYGYNADARFKGDGAIVYPNLRRRKLDPGLRFMNTRDGLQDADLFMQIFASGKKLLIAAAEKLLEEAAGRSFISRDDDSDRFNERYIKLLETADRI